MLPPSRLRALRSHFIARYSLRHAGSFAGCSCFRPFSCPSQLLHPGLKRLKPLFVTAGLQRTWLSLHSPSLGKASPHRAPRPAWQERSQPWEGGLTAPFFNHKTRQAEPQGVLFAPCKMPSPHLRCFIPRATPAGTAPGPALDCPNLPSSACPRRGRLEEATCPRINQPQWFPDVLSRWNLALRTGDTFATWKQQSIP